MYTVQYSCSIFDICKACDLSKSQSASFYGWLKKTEENCGIEFVVSELKHRYSVVLGSTKDTYRSHRDGTWFGAFRPISKLARKGRLGWIRALRILRLYGLFEAPPPELDDYVKHGESIASNPEPVDVFIFELEYSTRREIIGKVKGRDTTYPLRNTIVPLGRDITSSEVLTTPQEHIACLDNCPELVREFYDLFKELVGKTLPPVEHYDGLATSLWFEHDVVGSITLLTKDRGLKKRAVVNPFRILQLVLSRLSNTLWDVLSRDPDCWIYDQDLGAEWVAERLRQGSALTSIDLKSATDNIPMLPQIKLAQTLWPELAEDLRVFAMVSRSFWWTPYEKLDLQYTRGHGMGLNGSFPLFTLFLTALCKEVGARGRYAIVGDDLVVESRYTEKICQVLAVYGVPINHSKSLFSKSIAEFVGRLYDKRGNMFVYKAADFKPKADPLGLIRQYGPRAMRKTRLSKQSKMYKERLATFLLLKNDDDLVEALNSFTVSLSERRTLGTEPKEVYFEGGCPEEILDALIRSIHPKWGQYSYLQARDNPEISSATIANWIQNLEVQGSAFRPQWNVKSWSFPQNPKWILEYVENWRSRKAFGNYSDQDDTMAPEEPYLVTLLDSSVPDIETSLRDARMGKIFDRKKLEEERERKEAAPYSYISHLHRLALKLYARAITWIS